MGVEKSFIGSGDKHFCDHRVLFYFFKKYYY